MEQYLGYPKSVWNYTVTTKGSVDWFPGYVESWEKQGLELSWGSELWSYI